MRVSPIITVVATMFAASAPIASETMVTMSSGIGPMATSSSTTTQTTRAVISRRSVTRLAASRIAPTCERSPSWRPVAMRLTRIAMVSIQTLWCSGLSISPTTKTTFTVSASRVKKPKVTRSRFMAGSSHPIRDTRSTPVRR